MTEPVPDSSVKKAAIYDCGEAPLLLVPNQGLFGPSQTTFVFP